VNTLVWGWENLNPFLDVDLQCWSYPKNITKHHTYRRNLLTLLILLVDLLLKFHLLFLYVLQLKLLLLLYSLLQGLELEVIKDISPKLLHRYREGFINKWVKPLDTLMLVINFLNSLALGLVYKLILRHICTESIIILHEMRYRGLIYLIAK
jgi:hypothetical protein